MSVVSALTNFWRSKVLKKDWKQSQRFVAIGLVILAALGLLASLWLGYETLQVMKDPSYTPACNVSPVIGCSSVMASDQAEIFGIPNPVFGIMGFTALMTFAAISLFGVKVTDRLWQLVSTVALLGTVFMLYLFATSLLVIGSICPWCSLLWLTTIAIFGLVSTHAAAIGAFDVSKRIKKLARWWAEYSLPVIVALYVLMLALVFIRFSDYWLSLV